MTLEPINKTLYTEIYESTTGGRQPMPQEGQCGEFIPCDCPTLTVQVETSLAPGDEGYRRVPNRRGHYMPNKGIKTYAHVPHTCGLKRGSGCGLWDTEHPEVQAALRQREKSQGESIWAAARCRGTTPNCITLRRNRDREMANTIAVNYQNANLPQRHEGPASFGTIFLWPPLEQCNAEQRNGRETLARAIEAAKEWAKGEGAPILFIRGPEGNGKSSLVDAALRFALDSGHTARYEHCRELVGEVQATYGDHSGMTSAQRLDECKRADYLGLDDLGTERAKEDPQHILEGLFDHVLLRGKRLMLTSNLDSEQLKARLDPRVRSRLFAVDGTVLRVDVTAGDYRLYRRARA